MRRRVTFETIVRREFRGRTGPRQGKVLVLFAVLLPALLALIGLVLDGGSLLGASRRAQHAADAAATAAARGLQLGLTTARVTTIAEDYVQEFNQLPDAQVTVRVPPAGGPFAEDPRFVEVEVLSPVATHFLPFLGRDSAPSVRTRAVAGVRPATAGAALVVLDPDPPPLALGPIAGILPALPALVGGLEVLGVGTVRVDGAVLVNTEWGGVDENGNAAGEEAPPPCGIACLNLLANNRLRARDIRVVGGVDNERYYGNYVSGDASPLLCNKLPVSDPLRNVPPPTIAADPDNVSDVLRGGVRIADLILPPLRTLNPGVYDWIEIVAGRVLFNPGVYIIRGRNPITQLSLNILGGQVTADGVMFYITNSAAYSPAVGLPDANDGETVPPAPGVPSLLPSAVINFLLPGSVMTGLNDPGSPLRGLTNFQRRVDRRPIVIVNGLLAGAAFHGTVYAKWGHVLMSTRGTTDARLVAGSLRILAVLDTTFDPDELLPPATDVYLVE